MREPIPNLGNQLQISQSFTTQEAQSESKRISSSERAKRSSLAQRFIGVSVVDEQLFQRFGQPRIQVSASQNRGGTIAFGGEGCRESVVFGVILFSWCLYHTSVLPASM